MENNVNMEGYGVIDYQYAAVEAKASQETVFDLINGVISAVEAEAAARAGVPSLEHAPLTWEAIRVREFVERYDDFINDSDFQLDVFGVRKLEMENFWVRINAKNNLRVVTRQETYGGSSIYEIAKGKRVLGYLENNMTYDGQYAYFLTTKKAVKAARAAFSKFGKYPPVKRQNGQDYTRLGRIDAAVRAADETAVSAWSVLESEDARYFYGEMKKHAWLTQSDKQLLKAVRSYRTVRPFDCIVEDAEDAVQAIETAMERLEAKLEDLTANDETAKAQAVKSGIRRLSFRLDKAQKEFWRLTEEDNSQASETELGDYAW